jgi:hypothetical protein
MLIGMCNKEVVAYSEFVFCPEIGASTFSPNVSKHIPYYTASHCIIVPKTLTCPWTFGLPAETRKKITVAAGSNA